MKGGLAVLVTGCASGIGRRLAEDLVAAGHQVLLTDLDESVLRQRADRVGWRDLERVQQRTLDVRRPEHWRSAIAYAQEKFGRLDVLVNVAGVIVAGVAHELSDNQIDQTVDVNIKGVMHGTNEAARLMVAQGHGQIVNVASLAALAPVAGIAAYAASKHAVRAYTHAVAQELAGSGVHTTVICPGLVDTPMLDAQLDVDAAPAAFTSRPLTVERVSREILEALETRPLEVVVTTPFSGQAPISKLMNALPQFGAYLRPLMVRLGQYNQHKLRRSRR